MVDKQLAAAAVTGWMRSIDATHEQVVAAGAPAQQQDGFWDNVEELAGGALDTMASAVATAAFSPVGEIAAGVGAMGLGVAGVTVGTAATATGVLAPLGITMGAGSAAAIGLGATSFTLGAARLANGEDPIQPMQVNMFGGSKKPTLRESQKAVKDAADKNADSKGKWRPGDAKDVADAYGGPQNIPRGDQKKIPKFKPGAAG